MLVVPFLAAGALGYVLDSSLGYLYKFFLLLLLSLTLNGLVMIGFNIRSNIHIPQLSVTVDLLQIHDSGSSWCLPRLQAVDVPHLAGLHLCLRLQRSDHRHHHLNPPHLVLLPQVLDLRPRLCDVTPGREHEAAGGGAGDWREGGRRLSRGCQVLLDVSPPQAAEVKALLCV